LLNRFHFRIGCFILILGILIFAEIHAAEPSPLLQNELPATGLRAEVAACPAIPAKVGQVTLNFDDADVFSVIQSIFGDILKVNYIIDPRVKGRVNFRSVAPVAGEHILPIMEVILRLNGIGIVEDGGLYRIVPIGDLSKEPSPVHFGRKAETIPVAGKAICQVIPIQHLQSSDLIKMLSPFFSANAVVVDVPKGNQIILVDTDASVKRIVQLVEIFDSEKLRKRAEVFVFPIQNGNARDVAVLLQQIFLGAKPPVVTYPSPPITTPQLSKQSSASLPTPASTITPTTASPSTSTSAVSTVIPTATQGSSDSLLAEGTKIFPDEVANTIIVLATPEDYAIVKDTIQKIDMIPRQVVIEAVIAQVSLTDNLSLGIAWSLRANVFNLDTKIRLNPSSLNADPSIPTGSGLTILGVDSSGSVRALITALATESKAKLLATPHILVSDNREARIQVGQQVPLMTAETYATPGVAPQRIIQYRDIGIILRVKPRVNAGGLVNLEMNQEVSTFSTIVLFDNERQIILNKTEATTNFVVQDGHTIIIGGLIREDNSNSHSGIPFLSKIPIIGWLFGDTNRDKTRTEIIILLTPKVIRDQKGATALTSEYIENMTNKSKGGIKKEELMFRNTNPASGEIKKP